MSPTPRRTPGETLRRAQEQSRQIIARARAEAERIRTNAQDMREQLRANTREVREQTIERVTHARENARDATKQAVKLFRINLANTLTLFNGVFGFLAIVAAAREAFMLSAMFILIGMICDWLDGKAARAFGEETPLGKELDSLSDLVTFGVAPAFLVAMIQPGLFSFAAGALFVLSAALRLGRFNVQQTKGVFFGVPTTTNGILLPLMIFLGAPTMWFPLYLVIFALLMNAPITIKKIF